MSAVPHVAHALSQAIRAELKPPVAQFRMPIEKTLFVRNWNAPGASLFRMQFRTGTMQPALGASAAFGAARRPFEPAGAIDA